MYLLCTAIPTLQWLHTAVTVLVYRPGLFYLAGTAYSLYAVYRCSIPCDHYLLLPHTQVPVLSVLFLILACMNCSTLSSVIYKKSS